MDQIISWMLLLPIVIWAVFQAPLYNNATMVEESLKLAIYEGQKEASLKGKYDEEIYDKMKNYLVETHNYREELIEIKGTETLTPRGEELNIEVTVPQPIVNVLDIFAFNNTEPFTVKKRILSEYVD